MAGLRGDQSIEDQIPNGEHLTIVDKAWAKMAHAGNEREYLTERAAANKAKNDAIQANQPKRLDEPK